MEHVLGSEEAGLRENHFCMGSLLLEYTYGELERATKGR